MYIPPTHQKYTNTLIERERIDPIGHTFDGVKFYRCTIILYDDPSAHTSFNNCHFQECYFIGDPLVINAFISSRDKD